MSNPSIEERLSALEKRIADTADKIEELLTSTGTLWNSKTIARHCDNTSLRRTRDTVLKDKNFPRPRMMPGGGKRWVAAEVRQYLHDLERG